MYSVYCIEESDTIRENICYVISIYKENQKGCENSFNPVIMTENRNDHVIKTFNNDLLYYLSLEFYSFLLHVNRFQLFNGFIPLVKIHAIKCVC